MLCSEIIGDVREALGRCSDVIAYKRLSEAVQLLSAKGNWELLVGYVDICANVDCRTVTLPREIDTPLAVNVGGSPQIFRNKWTEFHFNGPGSFAETSWTWDDKGFSPVVMDILQAATVVAVAELKTDINTRLRIYGYLEGSGSWIRSQDPDGTWHDGFDLPVNLNSDFPNGIIQENTVRLFRRIWKVADITSFESLTAHQLTTGAPVVLSLVTAPMPPPLVAGTTYYVRAIDDTHASLHTTQQGALTNTQIVKMTSVDVNAVIKLTDQRAVKVQTQFLSSTNHNFRTGMLVEFTATTFPSPLVADTNYVARVIDVDEFTVHATLDDAENNVNPIDVINPGTNVVAIGKQPLAPVTILNFSVNHNLLTADAVRMSNNSGSLPEPLLEGVTYYVRVISSTSVSIHNTVADATNNTNAIVLVSTGSGTTSIVKTLNASASVGASSNITAAGHNLSTDTVVPDSTTATRQRTSNVATLTTAANHGLTTGLFVNISTMGDVTYNTTQPVQITVTGLQSFTYSSIGTNEAVTADVAGTVNNAPSNGDFVQFSSDGTLPNPLTQGTVYQAEPPITPNTFTVYDTNHQPVDIVTTGSGQLFLLISRTFNVGFNSSWRTDASLLATGDGVFVRSTGTLPSTVPAINDTTQYFVRKIDANTIELYDTAFNAGNGPSVVGRFTVNGVGSGDVTLELERSVTPVPSSSLLRGSSVQFWQDGATVQFTTDGTLPSPLALLTDYKVSVEDGFFRVRDTLDNIVTLTDIGSGNHKLAISKNFSVSLPTSVQVVNNEYEDGSGVNANTDGTVPNPLVAGSMYFLRRIDDDNVEIYDTAANAINIPATLGRIIPTQTGTGEQFFDQVLPAYRLQKVERVEKAPSQGFIELFAWDNGRVEALTLLGRYYPDEIDPRYRRIMVGCQCKWVRMRYRRKNFDFSSSSDWIPMRSKPAILMMVRAMELYRSEFSDQAEKYETKALQFLKEDQESVDGPTTVEIQFNDQVWTRPWDQEMY